jgi:hypothetical protein
VNATLAMRWPSCRLNDDMCDPLVALPDLVLDIFYAIGQHGVVESGTEGLWSKKAIAHYFPQPFFAMLISIARTKSRPGSPQGMPFPGAPTKSPI